MPISVSTNVVIMLKYVLFQTFQGHGEYSELSSEKDFFPTVQKSKLAVIHFYRQSTYRCQIVDKHLKLLAPKHLETRFVKINAEKCPFLVGKSSPKL